nr:DUF5131 family protein [Bradyrhizobium vignae]
MGRAGLPGLFVACGCPKRLRSDLSDHLERTAKRLRNASTPHSRPAISPRFVTGIQWAIVRGESGPRSRPMAEEWVREIESACREAARHFFQTMGRRSQEPYWQGSIGGAPSMRCRLGHYRDARGGNFGIIALCPCFARQVKARHGLPA